MPQPQHTLRFLPPIFAAALALALALPASAQNALGTGHSLERNYRTQQQRGYSSALGTGRALDANLQQGSGGFNLPVRDLSAQIRFNNAVVTGNAAFGRSFRGDVGYLATDEFRGALGANDLFNFRRDATASSMVTQGIRGSDALRYQFALSTGAAPPPVLAAAPIVSRAGASAAANTSTGGALRSTSDFLTSQSLSPSILGYRNTSQGEPVTVTASPLIGVRSFKLRPGQFDPAARGLGDGAPAPGSPDDPDSPASPVPEQEWLSRLPGMTGLESSPSSLIDSLSASRQLDTAGPSARAEPRSAAHRRLVETLNLASPKAPVQPGTIQPPAGTGPAGAPPQLPAENEELRRMLSGETLREKLDAIARERDAADAEAAKNAVPPNPNDPDAGRPNDPRAPDATDHPRWERGEIGNDAVMRRQMSTLQRQSVRGMGPAPDEAAINALLAGRAKLDSLLTANDMDRKAYAAYMKSGQDAIARSRYFDAEDRFTRALSALPGEPMAQIGRVHAQIGAGMYVSAATNLRSLLRAHPEMAATTYDPSLLPGSERIAAVIEQLRASIARPDSALGSDAALLLAYLGYQRQNPDILAQGLDALAECASKDAGTEEDRAAEAVLVSLLHSLWVIDAD